MTTKTLLTVVGTVITILTIGSTAEAQMTGGFRHQPKRLEQQKQSRGRVPEHRETRTRVDRHHGPHRPIHGRPSQAGPCYYGMVHSPCAVPGPIVRIEIGGGRK